MSEVKFRSDVGVELIDKMGSEASIVRAARVSTLGSHAEAEESSGLIRYLLREGHTSPFEHVTMTLRLEVPLFVQNQIVRHRTFSYNIESGRYREFEPVFYVPDSERPVKQVGKTGAYEFVVDTKLSKEVDFCLRDASEEAWDTYQHLLSWGAAKEVARSVLPVNLYSTMYMTGNLHNWVKFVKNRTSEWGQKPQYETELVGQAVLGILDFHFPTVIDAI